MILNDVFDVMLDVSALVTRGSDLARSEARRVAAERERRAAATAQSPTDRPAATVAYTTEWIPVHRHGGPFAAWIRAVLIG